jgi:hypothetical protein
VVEQILVADSATPPRWHEINLLVTEFKKEFETRAMAIEAIQSGYLGDSIHGLCRRIDEFTKEKSEIYKKVSIK